MRSIALVAAFWSGAVAAPALAQDAQIAVAANFTAPAEELGVAFMRETGFELGFSFGATGQFFAQITQGAPFDAFLSADARTPERLAGEGYGEPASVFTYAIGRLVLFSVDETLITGPESLETAFERLAIAEPAAAPYGGAAVETLKALNVYENIQPRLVVGQNISQAYQFVDTGNAEMGFVALAQVMGRPDGSRWIVGQDLHAPIAQDAILLSPGNQAAEAFLDFLRSGTGRAIMESYGYEVGL